MSLLCENVGLIYAEMGTIRLNNSELCLIICYFSFESHAQYDKVDTKRVSYGKADKK